MRRKTKETDIIIEIGERGSIETGDQILDHLLQTFFFYMKQPVRIKAKADMRHHLWEDIGITLGKTFNQKIEREKIARYGSAVMPMDDALILISLDISRAYLNVEFSEINKEQGFEPIFAKELLQALSRTLDATIHVIQLAGQNSHHVLEALFKGLGVAFSQAVKEQQRIESTKGTL